MSPGCLSIFVALVAVFSGVLIYINVRCICPKITPEDSLIIPVLSYVYHVISSVGEKLGISPRYRTVRLNLNEAPELLGLNLKSVDEVETIEDTTIAGVPVRIYRPRNNLAQQQERPGLIFFHGGGLVLFNARSIIYNKICSRFANVTQAVVIWDNHSLCYICKPISVDYRRAPEHPFPAQFEDSYAVVTKVFEDSSKFGITKSKVAMAGGGLGIVLVRFWLLQTLLS